MKRVYILLLVVAFVNFACSRYYPVGKDDITEYESDDKIKLILKSGREIVGDSLSYNISEVDTTILLKSEQGEISIPYKEVQEMCENQIDTGRSIFTGLWIFLSILSIFYFTNYQLGG